MEHGIEQVVNCELNQGKLHDPSLEKKHLSFMENFNNSFTLLGLFLII